MRTPRRLALASLLVPAVAFAEPNFLVTDFSSRIIRYDDITAEPFTVFVGPGISPLFRPRAMALAPDGQLVVTDTSNSRIYKYNSTTGQYMGEFAEPGNGLSAPADVLFDGDRMLVSSYSANKVMEFDAHTGEYIRDLVAAGSGGLSRPWGLLFMPDGDLLVASHFNDQVLRYNGQTGAFVGVHVVPGSGGLDAPTVMVRDGNFLLVAGLNSDNVVRYDLLSGTLINELIPRSFGVINGPTDMLIGPDDGLLYVSNDAGSDIRRFNITNGQIHDVFIMSGDGGLNSPRGIFLLEPAPTCDVDITGDGIVNFSDLNAVLNNFGAPCEQ